MMSLGPFNRLMQPQRIDMVDGIVGAVDVVVGTVGVAGGGAGDESVKFGVVIAVSKRVSRSLRSFSLEHCPRRRKHSSLHLGYQDGILRITACGNRRENALYAH